MGIVYAYMIIQRYWNRVLQIHHTVVKEDYVMTDYLSINNMNIATCREDTQFGISDMCGVTNRNNIRYSIENMCGVTDQSNAKYCLNNMNGFQ